MARKRSRKKPSTLPMIGIFLHVPRTGGTTLRLIMEAAMPPGQILPIYGRDIEHPAQVFQRLHEPTRRALKIIRGHVPYGLHDSIGWAQCMYFTLLRNPVDRVWSLWNYAKRNKQHHLYESLRKLDSLQAAVESKVSVEFNNGMCRQLSGLDGPFPQRAYAETSVPYGNTSQAFEVTLNHLHESTIAMGTTEYFDAFVEMLCKTFNWTPGVYKPANAGPPRSIDALSKGDLEAVAYYNRDDYLLWSTVTEAILL